MTDARDAYVIAARTMPHTLRRVGTDDETLAEFTVLAGYDDDLAAQTTRLTNRLRDALLHVHPALERLLGPRMDRGGVLDLLAAAPTSAALRQLGHRRDHAIPFPAAGQYPAGADTRRARRPGRHRPGTTAFGRVITGVAAQLREVQIERDTLAAELETRLEAHPLAEVLTDARPATSSAIAPTVSSIAASRGGPRRSNEASHARST